MPARGRGNEAMTASTDGETLRRSKRTKTTRKRPSTLGKQFDDDDDTAVTDELRLMVNQLQRDELEKLVMRLVSQSVDCAEIIEMETAQGRLQKAVTSFQVGGMAGYSQLGALGKLPAELIAEILSYLSAKELMVVTSQVCKALQGFRWLKHLWTRIDTGEIPYTTLFESILPTLTTQLPGCIKHANILYKTNSLPKAERLLNILARYHQLETLKLTQSSAAINQKRLENVRKFAEDFPGFRHIKHFTLDMSVEYARDYSIAQAERAIDLVAYWPELRSFTMTMPGGRDRLSLNYIRRLSECGSSVKPGPKTLNKNYITNLDLTGGMLIDAEILIQLGDCFPELERLRLTNIYDISSLDGYIQRAIDYDRLISRLPRLRNCELRFKDAKKQHTETFSVLFLAMLKAAPMLEKYIFANTEAYEKLKIFSAIRKWKGGWSRIVHHNLKHLHIKDWAIEWKLLSHKGQQCEFPNLHRMEAPGCITIESTDLVALMKYGGKA